MRLHKSIPILVMFTIAVFTITPSLFAAGAKSSIDLECAQNPNSSFCTGYKDNDNPATTSDGVIAGVVNLLFYAAGALAVIMVIYGGFRYVKSDGDSNKISEAKQTIIYALVGLVVALVARPLILFVLNRLL